MKTDWIPFELVKAGNRSLVRWVDPGDHAFPEPFFAQTIRALLSGNAPQKLTPVEELADIQPLRAPKGFIFHVARCGSTLVSRSLAAVPGHRVISEPSPLNQLLLVENMDESVRLKLLKGLIHALCGTAADKACFIKFTSWNLLFLEQILALFPDTPWIFIYREPTDVLQSLTRDVPRWATNQKLAEIMRNPHATGLEQMTFTLETMFKAPLPHLNQFAQPINYCQLPEAILEISTHLGLSLNQTEQERIVRMGQFDAKQTGEIRFHPRKREPLSSGLQEKILPLNFLYQKWEQIRADQRISIDQ